MWGLIRVGFKGLELRGILGFKAFGGLRLGGFRI